MLGCYGVIGLCGHRAPLSEGVGAPCVVVGGGSWVQVGGRQLRDLRDPVSSSEGPFK